MGSKAYRLWDPVTHSVVISTNVGFDEMLFPNQRSDPPKPALEPLPSSSPHTPTVYIPGLVDDSSDTDPWKLAAQKGKARARSPSTSSSSSESRTATPPPEIPPPSSIQVEPPASHMIPEPTTPPNSPPVPEPSVPRKRPTCKHKPVKHYEGGTSGLGSLKAEGDFWEKVDQVYAESVSTLLAVNTPNNEPRTYREVLNSPDKHKWVAAMEEELESLNKLGVWEVVDKPSDRKPVGCKWVLRIKYNGDGKPVRYKARLVAKGYSQVDGLDYGDTFAPVTRLETIRLFLAMAAAKDWEVRHIDVKTAYLYGDLDEEIYMETPEGYDLPNRKVFRLHKALYGLKQAGRQWYLELKKTLTQFGMTQLQSEPHMFHVAKTVDGVKRTLILPVYVNDLLPIGDKVLTDEFEKHIGKYYETSPPTDAGLFLGMKIERMRSDDEAYISIDQTQYATGIFECLSDTLPIVPATTPLLPSTKLVANVELKENADPKLVTLYQKLMGVLMWLALGTRPDITHAVGMLSRFSSNPSPQHQDAVTRVFGYITNTSDYTLFFKRSDSPLEENCIEAWTDTDDERKSISGFLFRAYGSPFSWLSKKQTTVATSTTESEYTTLYQTALQAKWISQLLEEIGFPLPQPLEIYSDSTAAISIAKGQSTHSKSKHFDVKLHKVRELVERNIIAIMYCRSQDNHTDVFTKQLPRDAFLEVIDCFGFDFPLPSPDPVTLDPDTSAAEISQYMDAPET